MRISALHLEERPVVHVRVLVPGVDNSAGLSDRVAYGTTLSENDRGRGKCCGQHEGVVVVVARFRRGIHTIWWISACDWTTFHGGEDRASNYAVSMSCNPQIPRQTPTTIDIGFTRTRDNRFICRRDVSVRKETVSIAVRLERQSRLDERDTADCQRKA